MPVLRVDVVAAVRDEEQNLVAFTERLRALTLPPGVELGIVLVEDSSSDGTRPLLVRLAREHPRFTYFALAEGFGQGPAIVFGARRSEADAVVMMDADGSHPPEAIPELVAAFLEGAQIAQCVRRRLDNRRAYRRLGAIGFRYAMRLLTGTDFGVQNVYYRLLSRERVDWLLEHPRYWRFLRLPLPRDPAALRFVEIDCREREAGESKYDFLRLARLGADGALSLISPARLTALGGVAALVAAGTFAAGAWPLSLGIVLVSSAAVKRYHDLDRPGLLARMQVVQSSVAGECD